MATEKRNSHAVYTFSVNETPCNSKHNNTHKASVRRFSSVLLLPIVAICLILANTQEAKAVTYEPLPNRPEYRGFHYCLDMADYPYLLNSNMPYKILQGYIVADSLVKSLPCWNCGFDTLLRHFNLLSDTAQYMFKYWYLMNEYDPLRFHSFTRKKYPEVPNNPFSLYTYLSHKTSLHPKARYVDPSYILHVYVNNTVWIDTANTNAPPSDIPTETIAFCRVLDTLKGGAFPSLDNAIFYNGPLQNNENAVIGHTYSIPNQTDVVFTYRDQWERRPGRELIDPKGVHWIKPNKEYIVFLDFFGIDAVGSWDPIGSVHKSYYDLSPYPLKGSFSMYPIEDGNVLDETNVLGFGTSVPIDVFKQSIRDKINEIKNYGE